MNYITGTQEYRSIRNKYNSINEMVEKAFNTDEIELLQDLKIKMQETAKSDKRKEFIGVCVDNDLGVCAYLKLSGGEFKYKADNYIGIESLKYTGKYGEVLDVAKQLVHKHIPLPNCFVEMYKGSIQKEIEIDRLGIYLNKYRVEEEAIKEDIEYLNIMKNTFKTVSNEEVAENLFVCMMKTVQAFRFLTGNGRLSTGMFDNVVKKLYRYTYYVNGQNGERLATKKEKQKMLTGVFKRKRCLISKENEKSILLCCWIMTGNNSYYSMCDLLKIDNNEDKIKTYVKEITKAMEYMTSYEFIEVDKDILLKTPEFTDYLESAEDELLENVKILDMMKLIKRERDPDIGDKYDTIAWKIAAKAIKTKNYELTENQLTVITISYNKIVKEKKAKNDKFVAEEVDIRNKNFEQFKKDDNEEKINYYSKELDKQVREVKKVVSKRKNNTYYEFVLSLCNSIIKKKYASKKQMDIIMKMYEDKIAEPLADMLSSVDMIDEDTEETAKETEMPKFGATSGMFTG